MGETAWKWGAYRKGMGKPDDDQRMKYACSAIKQMLTFLGYDGINLETSFFGANTAEAVRLLQVQLGIKVDSQVGMTTASGLWAPYIRFIQGESLIPDNWLRAQIQWESLNDPGALYDNGSSVDRGLCQINSQNDNLSEDEAFTPSVAIPFLGDFLKVKTAHYKDCEVDSIKLAVGSWRTPVGADEWCDNPDLTPLRRQDGGTWGQAAVFYVDRVNTYGRLGWVG